MATERGPALVLDRLLPPDGGDALALSLTVGPGDAAMVVDAAGAAGDLFVALCAGTIRPRGGRILLAGADVTRLPTHRRSRLGLVRVLESAGPTLGSLSVRESLLVASALRHRNAPKAPALSARHLDDLLAALGLTDVRRLPIGALRPLEARLVSLARALAMAPTVVVAAHLTRGLEPQDRAPLAAGLDVATDRGVAIVLAEASGDALPTGWSVAADLTELRWPAAGQGNLAAPTTRH